MRSIELLYNEQAWLFYIFLIIFGLIFGSFFNLLIYRLPQMLFHNWRLQCQEFLKLPQDSAIKLNLATPRSFCPKCKTQIKAIHNIPIISYLFLMGKCANCQQKISLRYPFIELLATFLIIICFLKFGFSLTSIFATIFCWLLLIASFIDIDHQIIPDEIIYILLWLGLLINLNSTFVPIEEAIIGALIGYLFLWSFVHLYKLITGKIGMGHGDFKLAAAIGAWLGWNFLPFLILLSSIVGVIISGTYLLLYNKSSQTPIPFGPYLAIAAVIGLFYYDKLL